MRRMWVSAAVFMIGCPIVQAADPVRLAVMEFSTKGGVTQEQMDALGDLLATEIRRLGDFQVIGRTDIRAAFQIEEQKRSAGCTDESCIAEVGGALGVKWVVLGNVGLFGETYLLNLKIMDVEVVKIAASVSESIRGGQDELVDILPDMVRELFESVGGALRPASVQVTESAPGSPHSLWGHVATWTGAGCLVLGGISAWQASEAGGEYDRYGDPDDKDASRTWSGVMWAGFGIGTALVATGIALWLLEPAGGDTNATVVPLPDGAGLVFSLGGRW